MRRSSIYKSDFWYKAEPWMCYINKNLPDYYKKKRTKKTDPKYKSYSRTDFSLMRPINPGSGNYSKSLKCFFISDWMIQFVYKFPQTVATLCYRIDVSPWELEHTSSTQSIKHFKAIWNHDWKKMILHRIVVPDTRIAS